MAGELRQCEDCGGWIEELPGGEQLHYAFRPLGCLLAQMPPRPPALPVAPADQIVFRWLDGTLPFDSWQHRLATKRRPSEFGTVSWSRP